MQSGQDSQQFGTGSFDLRPYERPLVKEGRSAKGKGNGKNQLKKMYQKNILGENQHNQHNQSYPITAFMYPILSYMISVADMR